MTFRGLKSPKTPILGPGISSLICEKVKFDSYCRPPTKFLLLAAADSVSCGQQQKLRGWSRMVVKQFQDGGRPPFWKSIYRIISVKNHPNSMKFCTQQILNFMNITWSKMMKLHWTDCEFDRTYFLFVLLSLSFIPRNWRIPADKKLKICCDKITKSSAIEHCYITTVCTNKQVLT